MTTRTVQNENTDSSPELPAVLEWNLSSDSFYYSEAFKRYRISRGRDRNFLKNLNTLDGVHPEDRSLLRDMMERILNGAERDVEMVRLELNSGDQHWTRVESQSTRDSSGMITQVTASIIDMDDLIAQNSQPATVKLNSSTDEQVARAVEIRCGRNLRWQTQRFQMLARYFNATTFDYDVENDRLTVSGIDDQNRYQEHVLEGAEANYKVIAREVHPDQRQQYLENWERLKKEPFEGTIEYQLMENGKYVWYLLRFISIADEKGRIFRILSLLENIQDRKEKESILVAKERAFRTSVNSNAMLSMGFDMTTCERLESDEDVIPDGIPDTVTLNQFIELLRDQMYPEDVASAESCFNPGTVRDALNDCRGAVDFDCRMRSISGKYGGYRWLKVRYMFASNPKDGHNDLFVLITDIQDEKLEKLALVKAARTDPLTGLLNINAFQEHCNCKRAMITENDLFCFTIIDIDNFKQLNDRYGYQGGDRLLKKSALTLSTLMNKNDHCGRLAGDSFIVCMDGNGDREFLKEKLRIMKTALTRDLDSGLKLTVSMGAVLVAGSYASVRGCSCFETVYDQADQAVRQAMASGGDCMVVVDPDQVQVKKACSKTIEKKTRVESVLDQENSSTSIIEEKERPRVYIRTFGYFDVFVNGTAIPFCHTKAKELLALLTDRRGGYLTSKEAISCLWENES
ncbi:MAG: diguanylate cyclase, partial [Eubacteriaceae bacterium]